MKNESDWAYRKIQCPVDNVENGTYRLVTHGDGVLSGCIRECTYLPALLRCMAQDVAEGYHCTLGFVPW